ncbi:uncharacterized protein LOC135689371 [Rhopilema esculentum]|uniref:uncharacterized protein LOC135689371 n=1 Tax=Rhopilema esculentum TaxID=499914 RepID=UPI0031D524C0|eukprot:gene8557-14558_t
MTTGDIKNNLQKLVSELKGISYDIATIDFDALVHGIPSAFLPMIHYTFLDYSPHLASYLAKRNYDLYVRTDLRFVETVFKILMKEFSYKPNLKKEQFLALGFAERKIIFVTDMVRFCREKTKLISSKKNKTTKSSKSLSQSRFGHPDQNFHAINSSSSSQTHSVTSAQNIENESQTIPDREINQSKLVMSEMLKPETTLNMPMPYPAQFAFSEQISPKTKIPQPSDSLLVTPIKDIEIISDKDSNSESVPRKSRADIIDVDDNGPKTFKVISHLFNQSETDGTLFESSFGDGKDSNSDHIHVLKAMDIQDESITNKNLVQKSTNMDAKNNSCAVQHSCECKMNESLAKDLQEQVQILSKSLKDVIAMNNDLSARVVLLETQCRLMEGSIEVMASRLDKEQEEGIQKTFGHKTRAVKLRNQKRGQGHLSSVDPQPDEINLEYSPDKYTDIDNTLPADFQPLTISDEEDVTSFEPKRNDNKDEANEILDDQIENIHAPSGQTGAYDKDSDKDQPALSPLHETEFSFMEEGTKTTVRNLQKRLEETMNLFKLSSTTIIVENQS